MSDIYFLHDLQRAILSRINSKASGKTFFYRFACDTLLNIIKIMLNVTQFPGAAHWDDLPYLFRTDPTLKVIDSPRIDENFKYIKIMVDIFTSFAINGDPQTAETENLGWNFLTSAELPLTCLNISNDLLQVIPFPEAERLKIWDEVFDDAGSPLY